MSFPTDNALSLARDRAQHALALIIVAAGLAAGPAQAAPSAEATYTYKICHSLFGEIGSHNVRIVRRGGNYVVQTETRVTIRFLFMTVLRLHAWGRETWRGGGLVAFAGRSEEDGETLVLSARADGDRLVITGPEGRRLTAQPVALTNPWQSAVLEAPVLLEATSGKLLRVHATAGGEHQIDVSGRAVRARKHVISGEAEADVWFAPDGTWLRMDFFKAGGRVTIALERVTRKRESEVGALAATVHGRAAPRVGRSHPGLIVGTRLHAASGQLVQDDFGHESDDEEPGDPAEKRR